MCFQGGRMSSLYFLLLSKGPLLNVYADYAGIMTAAEKRQSIGFPWHHLLLLSSAALWCDGVSQRGLHSLHHLSLCSARTGAPPAVGAAVPRRWRSSGQAQRGSSQHAVTSPSYGRPGPHAHLHVHR